MSDSSIASDPLAKRLYYGRTQGRAVTASARANAARGRKGKSGRRRNQDRRHSMNKNSNPDIGLHSDPAVVNNGMKNIVEPARSAAQHRVPEVIQA